MLMFGKNLKKIRSVRGISQQEFADIFDLKRGTLGAYEEERSNPKLETVLKIANHFSIGIEELLTKELTVNRLLKFNERMTTESDSHILKEFDGIPYIATDRKLEFVTTYKESFKVEHFPLVRLPNIETLHRFAFMIDDLSMTGGSIEFFPKDIVIGIEVDKNTIRENQFVMVLANQQLVLRRISFQNNLFILKADHHGVADSIINSDEIQALWSIEHVFHHALHSKEMLLEDRLARLEQSIASLKK